MYLYTWMLKKWQKLPTWHSWTLLDYFGRSRLKYLCTFDSTLQAQPHIFFLQIWVKYDLSRFRIFLLSHIPQTIYIWVVSSDPEWPKPDTNLLVRVGNREIEVQHHHDLSNENNTISSTSFDKPAAIFMLKEPRWVQTALRSKCRFPESQKPQHWKTRRRRKQGSLSVWNMA